MRPVRGPAEAPGGPAGPAAARGRRTARRAGPEVSSPAVVPTPPGRDRRSAPHEHRPAAVAAADTAVVDDRDVRSAATGPAKVTVPGPAERTTVPGPVAYRRPRLPAHHVQAGAGTVRHSGRRPGGDRQGNGAAGSGGRAGRRRPGARPAASGRTSRTAPPGGQVGRRRAARRTVTTGRRRGRERRAALPWRARDAASDGAARGRSEAERRSDAGAGPRRGGQARGWVWS